MPPPFGRLTWWERLFGCNSRRRPPEELSFFSISPIWLETDIEIPIELEVEIDASAKT
jgi:hypothetical protein